MLETRNCQPLVGLELPIESNTHSRCRLYKVEHLYFVETDLSVPTDV